MKREKSTRRGDTLEPSDPTAARTQSEIDHEKSRLSVETRVWCLLTEWPEWRQMIDAISARLEGDEKRGTKR